MKVLAKVLICLALAGPASAQDIIDSYTARIGPEDRVNSSGMPLTRIDQFLQQDRANLHRFGISQAGDTADRFFADRDARAMMTGLLQAGRIDPDVRRELMSGGDPLLQVEVHGSAGRARFVTVRAAGEQMSAEAATPVAPSASSGPLDTGHAAPPTASSPAQQPSQTAPQIAQARSQSPMPMPMPTPAQTQTQTAAEADAKARAASASDPRLPPLSEEISCSLPPKGITRWGLRCEFKDGRVMEGRITNRIRVQFGLHTLGCSVPVIEPETIDRDAGMCFVAMFGLKQRRLSDVDQSVLAGIEHLGDRERLLAELKKRGYELGGKPEPVDLARAFVEAVDHPLRDLFLHPRDQSDFLSAKLPIEQWMSGQKGSRGLHSRWADAPALSGRSFSIVLEGAPLFLIEFGEEDALVRFWNGRSVDTYKAPYRTQNELVCVDLRGNHVGECLSIVLALSGPQGAYKGETWGALLGANSGLPVPILFSPAVEGSSAWDAALAAAEPAELSDIPALPPAFKYLKDDAAMMALWRHEAESVDTPEMADAVMRSLFALSYHSARCHGPGPAVIPIRTVIETTTRNNVGVVKGRETENFYSELKVRHQFAELARRLIPYYSDSTLNRRFVAVRDLINQDRCDGSRLRRFEAGIAKAAGVDIGWQPPAPLEAGAIDEDWRAFVTDCLDVSYPAVTNGQEGAARICIVYDAIVREFQDPALQDELRRLGLAVGAGWTPEFQERFSAAFKPHWEDREGEVWQRFETYRKNNGF